MSGRRCRNTHRRNISGSQPAFACPPTSRPGRSSVESGRRLQIPRPRKRQDAASTLERISIPPSSTSILTRLSGLQLLKLFLTGLLNHEFPTDGSADPRMKSGWWLAVSVGPFISVHQRTSAVLNLSLLARQLHGLRALLLNQAAGFRFPDGVSGKMPLLLSLGYHLLSPIPTSRLPGRLLPTLRSRLPGLRR